jgi:hypothetical protein
MLTLIALVLGAFAWLLLCFMWSSNTVLNSSIKALLFFGAIFIVVVGILEVLKLS